MYQYTECGLDYVYLKNGYTQEDTDWGEAVTVEHVDDLHLAIGCAVVEQPEPLSGAELRFLRNELNMSQKSLGALSGYKDGQQVANWEKGNNPIPRTVDVVVRALYREKVIGGSNPSISAALDMLNDYDRENYEHRRVAFLEEDGQWLKEAA